MSINDRILEIINTMFAGNKTAFSKKVGISTTVIANIVGKRQSNPSYDVTKKIVSKIKNLNAEWYITGEGKMLKENTLPVIEDKDMVSEDQFYYKNETTFSEKPFIDSTISIDGNFSSGINTSDCKTLPLPFACEYDFSLRHYGDSMIDPGNNKSIYNLDIVACKIWTNSSYIRWGEIYALLTTEGIVIKKIMPSGTEDKIKCVSLNEEKYKTYELPVSSILDMAIVVATVTVKIM